MTAMMTPEQRARLEGCAMAGKWLVGTKASDVAAALAKIDALEARVGELEASIERQGLYLDLDGVMARDRARWEAAEARADALAREVLARREAMGNADMVIVRYWHIPAVRELHNALRLKADWQATEAGR